MGGGRVCTYVNKVVAAAHGGGFDVNSTVGYKKKKELICKQGRAAWDMLKASLCACTLLECHTLCRNALESVPSLLSLFISSVLQCHCEQFLVSPASICSN